MSCASRTAKSLWRASTAKTLAHRVFVAYQRVGNSSAKMGACSRRFAIRSREHQQEVPPLEVPIPPVESARRRVRRGRRRPLVVPHVELRMFLQEKFRAKRREHLRVHLLARLQVDPQVGLRKELPAVRPVAPQVARRMVRKKARKVAHEIDLVTRSSDPHSVRRMERRSLRQTARPCGFRGRMSSQRHDR